MPEPPPHRINLTRMWKPEAVDTPNTELRWINLSELAVADAGEPLRLVRNFNRPTNLDADSSVYLVFENLPPGTTCCLNDRKLGTATESIFCRFEVFELLQPSNCITLEIPRLKSTMHHASAWIELN